MRKRSSSSFLAGLMLGVSLAAGTGLLLAFSEAPNEADQRTSPSPPAVYFVTGDVNNATLWRRKADGTLVCISRNTCRSPRAGTN